MDAHVTLKFNVPEEVMARVRTDMHAYVRAKDYLRETASSVAEEFLDNYVKGLDH